MLGSSLFPLSIISSIGVERLIISLIFLSSIDFLIKPLSVLKPSEKKYIIEEQTNNMNNYILDYKIQSDIDPYLQSENDINQNIFDINEFKETNDFNNHQNNKYILNNVSEINKFITDKYNEKKNMNKMNYNN